MATDEGTDEGTHEDTDPATNGDVGRWLHRVLREASETGRRYLSDAAGDERHIAYVVDLETTAGVVALGGDADTVEIGLEDGADANYRIVIEKIS